MGRRNYPTWIINLDKLKYLHIQLQTRENLTSKAQGNGLFAIGIALIVISIVLRIQESSTSWVAFLAMGIIFMVIGSGARRRRAIRAEKGKPD